MSPILSVRNLSRNFGAIKAVDDVSFDLAKGELLALIGPNGAGSGPTTASPGNIRRRVESRSTTWCFTAPAICRINAPISSLPEMTCSAPKACSTVVFLGINGSDCPSGHQIGAKPEAAAWLIQPASGTITSDP